MIPVEVFLDFVQDKNRLYQRLSKSEAGQTFPEKERILGDTSLATFLRGVLVTGYSTEEPKMNPSLDLCNEKGWLQAEKSPNGILTYVFPSKLHRGYVVSNNLLNAYRQLINGIGILKTCSARNFLLFQQIGSQNCKGSVLQ